MTELLANLGYFHFLRPWWLALIPAVLFLWWRIRQRAMARPDPPGALAPHLAAALTLGAGGGRRIVVVDGVAVMLLLLVLAVAGPAWSRVPNPLVAETAPLAVVLEVSESMLQRDVAPSRLERAKHKVLDLLAARAGAPTALVAYAGTAHRVVPLTEDPEVLKPFLEGLSPEVMPSPGQNATAALTLARQTLAAEAVPGAVLFVLDDLDRADLAAFESNAADAGPRVVFLSAAGSAAALDDLGRVPGAAVVRLTPDATDVAEVSRRVASAYRDALAQDKRQRWDDRGWILAWPALLLALLWFRRGWTLRWALVVAALVSAAPGGAARAEGLADWFLTPDQQGRLAFEDKDFAEAAALFEDPLWKGIALYRSGNYAEAAQVFERLPSAGAAFAEGMARLKSRGYRPAITAFETALERDPGQVAAARNLEIARAILAYVERAREQSDTGEEAGIGADDVVFDNEAQRGTETRRGGETEAKLQTAEQWMRSVDTRTADFLRLRFALEAATAQP